MVSRDLTLRLIKVKISKLDSEADLTPKAADLFLSIYE